MAGLISALFGGKNRQPVETNPHPGIGGYDLPTGPSGQSGFPGSTHQTRTFKGNNPRVAKVRADTNTGFESSLGQIAQTRQASYRGDVKGAKSANPRGTSAVSTRQPVLTEIMQQDAGEFFGGPMLRTGVKNNTAGGQPGKGAVAAGGGPNVAQRDTTTPWVDAQPEIGVGIPGATNVRNEVAQRYKNAPGQMHSYKSAARPDQAPVNRGGQATDGNVHPERVSTDVTVLNRFVFDGGGNQSWSVLRDMPYGGKGNGKRGASLNGQRYYGTSQKDQFWNAGQGDYGLARKQGGDYKRPVSFDTPAPWTANYYDTTEGLNSDTNAQSFSGVYVSPASGRASNSTGRMS
jgi:hypothetical protein